MILAAGWLRGERRALMRRYFPEHFRNEGPINTLCLGSQTGDGLLMAEDIGLLMGEDMDPGIIGPGHHPWHHSLHEAVHAAGDALGEQERGALHQREPQRHGGWGAHQAARVLAVGPLRFGDQGPHRGQSQPRGRSAMDGDGWFRTLAEDLQAEAGWTQDHGWRSPNPGTSWPKKIGVRRRGPAGDGRPLQRALRAGRDADFVKDPQFLRRCALRPTTRYWASGSATGPRAASRSTSGMEVTRPRAGQPVEGLYATGDNTSGWVVDWGLPGTTLAFAFTSGYIAAESAASLLSPWLLGTALPTEFSGGEKLKEYADLLLKSMVARDPWDAASGRPLRGDRELDGRFAQHDERVADGDAA